VASIVFYQVLGGMGMVHCAERNLNVNFNILQSKSVVHPLVNNRLHSIKMHGTAVKNEKLK
jgi:hypothetical protein